MTTTVWVFGDQLNRSIGAVAAASPATHRILMVTSAAMMRSRPWHRQRLHLVLAAMHRFAADLAAEGFEVDLVEADDFTSGLADHRNRHRPAQIVATEPLNHGARRHLERLGVDLVRSNQFLCHYDEFAAWAEGRRSLKLEDFYRWQRRRLGYLMDGDEPVTGVWNYDHDNRRPAPADAVWPEPVRDELDDLDQRIIAALPETSIGAPPDGTWATTRAGALRRLEHFIDEILPVFGPHEDAMTTRSWHLAHSLLSPYLNIGLLLPGEVCDAAQRAFDDGRVPIASAEGFIRQIIGWREYVWGIYWQQMPDYRRRNHLDAHRPLPPALTGAAPTRMRCVATCLETLDAHAYNHHIQRLMVLGNLALIAGVDPWEMTQWMWASFIDGAEWVMVPNVIGMSLWADGGLMATKPYAAGGNYIDTMSDYCSGCRFDRKKRVGPDACPFTTLYWDFMMRHHDELVRNPRVARQVRAAERLSDIDEVRHRATEVLAALDRGEL